MLEVVIGLGIISFIYAYIYSQIPKENAWYKFLFLSLTFFSIIFLIWNLSNLNTTTEIKTYSSSGEFLGVEVQTSSLPNPIKETLLTYMDVTITVTIFVLAITLVLFIYQTFKGLIEKKKEKLDFGE